MWWLLCWGCVPNTLMWRYSCRGWIRGGVARVRWSGPTRPLMGVVATTCCKQQPSVGCRGDYNEVLSNEEKEGAYRDMIT